MAEKLTVYTDGHIPLAVARQCRARAPGVTIIRCEEVGMKDADDAAHWEYVLAHWAVLVTADRGFLARAAALNQQGESHPGIIYVGPDKQGSACIGPIVEWLAFLDDALQVGAADLERDVDNRIKYIG